MTTQRDDDRIVEIERSLKTAETRLENTEAKQNTTAQRLDELYKALLERLDAKNDTLDRFTDEIRVVIAGPVN